MHDWSEGKTASSLNENHHCTLIGPGALSFPPILICQPSDKMVFKAALLVLSVLLLAAASQAVPDAQLLEGRRRLQK